MLSQILSVGWKDFLTPVWLDWRPSPWRGRQTDNVGVCGLVWVNCFSFEVKAIKMKAFYNIGLLFFSSPQKLQYRQERMS